MTDNRWMVRRSIALLFGGLVLLLAGCTLVQLRHESQEFYRATVLVGRVTPAGDWDGPVIVAAAARGVIVHQVWLHEPGGYELMVPDGKYQLFAYGDSDGDGAPDASDPAAVFEQSVEVDGQGIITLLDLTLAHGQQNRLAALPAADLRTTDRHSTQVGAPVKWDDPAFSAARGVDAYWSPLESFRRTGGNIYFVEPYDPARTPVLFVHGAAGSAQDFRFLAEHLDRSRYQAWIFQYPSGAELESISHLLYWKLINTQVRFGFNELHIVAHSMGGLVVRRFLVDHGDQFPQLRQFVSISTPWNGETAATLGVEHSPAVVPSWRDMQPQGEFLGTLFTRDLPAHVRHTLLFGHRGGYSLLRPTTDGTVTLASQLRPEAQAQAQRVLGFDESHDSILKSEAVCEQIERALGPANERSAEDKGEIFLTLDAEDRSRLAGSAIPIIMLTQADADEPSPAKWVPLQSLDGMKLEPGVYDIHLLAGPYRSTPHRQRVEVQAGRRSEIAFALTPDGVLSGYIGAQGDSMRFPAGSWRPPASSVKVGEVVLSGSAIERRLRETASSASADFSAAVIDRRDVLVGSSFAFFDLPDGEYTLEVRADGYQPHVSRHRVVAGKLSPTTPIQLRKL